MTWLSRLNLIPAFPAHTGPYKVATVDVELPVCELQQPSGSSPSSDPFISTIAFRIFYPCDPSSAASRPVHWLPQPQRSVLSAYARFLGASPGFSNIISYFPQLLFQITIPATRDAPLHTLPYSSNCWPVLVFSHGLGGSRNSYSHLCGSLASHGLVVLALDHRDGSQPISHIRATANLEARTIDYRSISHKPSKDVYDARDEQLKIRLWELGLVYQFLLKVNNGGEVTNLNSDMRSKRGVERTNILSMFRNKLDIRPGSVTFAGHSFGAATTVQLVKSVFYSSYIRTPISTHSSTSLNSQITASTPIILLDLWALPLNSPSTSSLRTLPLPCFSPSGPGGSSALAILSEAFVKWRANLRDVKKAMSDPYCEKTGPTRPSAHLFYPIKSAHLGQSDFGLLFPNVTKYLAKADEPERTLRLNVRAILEVLRSAGVCVAETSVSDMEDQMDGNLEKSEESRNDYKILDRSQGAVRGWVSLSAQDDVDDLVQSKVPERIVSAESDSSKASIVHGEKNDSLRGAMSFRHSACFVSKYKDSFLPTETIRISSSGDIPSTQVEQEQWSHY